MTPVIDDTKERSKLGEILVRRNIITEEQLNQALDRQKKEADYVGDILIRLGFAQERDIVVALVVQYNLPYIAIHNYAIDQDVLKLIPPRTARELHVLPLDRVGDVLSVVMADPLSEDIKNTLFEFTRCTIAPFIATKTEIQNAIKRWYA